MNVFGRKFLLQRALVGLALVTLFVLAGCAQSARTTALSDEATPLSELVVEIPRAQGAIGSGRVTLDSDFNAAMQIEPDSSSLLQRGRTSAFFDFDSGQVTRSSDSDVYLDVSCGSSCFNILLAVNNALAVAGIELQGKEPGEGGCLAVMQDHKMGMFGIDMLPDSYSCVRSGSGNIVQIRVVENKPRSRGSRITFEYQLWAGH